MKACTSRVLLSDVWLGKRKAGIPQGVFVNDGLAARYNAISARSGLLLNLVKWLA